MTRARCSWQTPRAVRLVPRWHRTALTRPIHAASDERRMGRLRRLISFGWPRAGRFPISAVAASKSPHGTASGDCNGETFAPFCQGSSSTDRIRSFQTRQVVHPPEWLTAFIEGAAELFEPVAEVGRVGFDCRLDEEGWSAALYLGAVEVVGGKSDGQTEQPDFRFDLNLALFFEQFSRVDVLVWNVLYRAGGRPRRAAALVPVGRWIPRRESNPAGGPFVGSSTRRSRPLPPGRRAL